MNHKCFLLQKTLLLVTYNAEIYWYCCPAQYYSLRLNIKYFIIFLGNNRFLRNFINVFFVNIISIIHYL